MLMNRQSEEMKTILRGYQTGNRKPKEKKVLTDKELIDGKIHYTHDKKPGFPAAAFKAGMVQMAPNFGLYKKDIRGAVFVLGDIIPLNFKKMYINKVWGKVQGRRPIEIIRPEFADWSCKLTIRYNTQVISPEQIVNLLNWAGFHQGIGDWRPEKGGSFGQYQVKPGMVKNSRK
jgi:hypothetical protein